MLFCINKNILSSENFFFKNIYYIYIMSQYIDTQLLECNRLHSEEAKSGNNSNPALFTNKLGSGIKLDVGDMVSVHGAYISEVGAAGNTIEFKGASLGKIKQFTISNVSNTLPYDEDDVDKRINGFKRTIIRDETISRELFDNKASIKIGYYLNTMGQNTLQLPRRMAGRHNGFDAPNNFTQADEHQNGLPFNNRRIIVDADYKMYYLNTSIYKQRIDNKRFTIFARDTSVFKPDADFTYTDPDGIRDDVENMWMRYGDQDKDPYDTIQIPRNPAFWKYKQYSQIVDLEVNSGFNSAENVANELTNQLNRPLKEHKFSQRLFLETSPRYENIITTIETNTYKAFNAGSTLNMNTTNSNKFYDGNLADNISQGSYDYLNSYQYVGYKRPEIQTAGRNLPVRIDARPWEGTEILTTLFKSGSLTAEIEIDIDYNASNCALFGDFFKACSLYPELYDNLDPINHFLTNGYNKDKINFETSRWLHLNLNETTVYRNLFEGKFWLGGDNCLSSASAVVFDAPPVFFEYDSNSSDTFYKFPSRTKLSYGCMDKNASGKIKFYTEGVGGIPNFFYQDFGIPPVSQITGSEAGNNLGRRIGFDYSFQAWSTMAIMPFNGYNEVNKNGAYENGYQRVEDANYGVRYVSGLASQVYIGAQDPLISYNETSDRFEISKLHSLLKQQQNWGAGVNDDFPDLGPSVAGADVYKLNPIDNYFVFSTDIIPYQDKKAHRSNSSAFQYTQLNLNLEPWLVYDSYSGIFIDDFGFDGDEGLWSVLGFTQEQFNHPDTPENRIGTNRFDNNSIKFLNQVTTNAEVRSKDFSTYIQNIYGGTMFTQQIVIPQAVVENDRNHPAENYFSPISVAQNSVKIVAGNLPRRMLRPYYLLKTNLVDKNSFIGSRDSGQNFNVAAIIDKQYSGGDFFFFNSNVINFTITKPITLTSIQNSIHDPDGSFANVNNDSSVIYKIQKTKNLADLDILNQILQNRNQK